MNHLKLQVLFERVEITVAMEKSMTSAYAESGNNAVDRLANGNAPRT